MSTASRPSQFQGNENRVWHLGSTGCWRTAGDQVLPPFVDTSTRVMRPRPLHARPVMSHQPRPVSVAGNAGNVMIDLASMTNENIRAVPLDNGSVYFDVSSRVMNVPSANSRRRIHFTLVFPSHPGSSRRAG